MPGAAPGGAGDGPHTPLPPADLETRDVVPLQNSPRRLLRIHWPGLALYFGPDAGKAPAGRFDAPAGEYRVHYSGHTFIAAFVEAILRQGRSRAVPVLAWSDLAAREISTLETTRPVRVMPVHGDWLPPLGATAAVASGPYGPSRQWSRALWGWHQATAPLDGIQYPSRHNDAHLCLALFDRAASAMRVVSTESLATRRAEIEALERLYRRSAFIVDFDN